jgi:hypothetical protein
MYGARLLFAATGPAGLSDPNRTLEEHSSETPPAGAPPDYAGTRRLVEEFVACARDNRPPTIGAGARDGRRATLLALRAFESIRTGAPQAVCL